MNDNKLNIFILGIIWRSVEAIGTYCKSVKRFMCNNTDKIGLDDEE